MMTAKSDFQALVHTPAQLSQRYVQYAEEVRGNPGVPFGIPCVDAKVIPMRPGNLICFIARPGHGKTSLLAYLAQQEAARIVERGAQEKEAVVFVTWEQTAEELESFFQAGGISSTDIAWGRADLDAVKRSAVKRAGLPIWVIGYGIGRKGHQAPRMRLDEVLAGIELMEEKYNRRPTLLLFDYLQLVPVDNARDRIQQVTEAPIRVKELAMRVCAPAVCGVQARREVDDRVEKLPEMRDAQWASSIEQTSDKAFSLLRPIRYFPAGGDYEMGWVQGKPTVQITERLLALRLLKQRFDQGRCTWVLDFQPEHLRLTEMELRRPAPWRDHNGTGGG